MRLINADELRAKAVEDCPSCELNGSRYCRESCNVNAVVELIDSAASVTSITVPRGAWQGKFNGWVCSNCHNYQIHKTKFCPACGAKMQEEAST